MNTIRDDKRKKERLKNYQKLIGGLQRIKLLW